MLTWISDHRCRVGETEVCLSDFVDRAAEGLWLEKPRPTVEALAAILREHEIDRVVELGLKRGGSTVLINEVARPTKLVAIDVEARVPQALADYVAALPDPAVVALHFGVDQADRDRMGKIVTAEIDDAAIDLIIDDASHRFQETVASFEVLFPRLRPGGLYLLEDWNWQHLVAGHAANAHPDRDAVRLRDEIADLLVAVERSNHAMDSAPEPVAEGASRRSAPLTAFVQQLVLARAQSGDVVAELVVGPWWVRVRRGPAELDPMTFRLSDCYTDYFEEIR